MTKMEYAEYLASDHWKEVRNRKLANGAGLCERCDIPRWLAEIAYDQDLHVHHRSYARVGAEVDSDLEVLCRRCHDLETFGRTDFRKLPTAKCELCGCKHWNPREPMCDECLGLLAHKFGIGKKLDVRDPFHGYTLWYWMSASLGMFFENNTDARTQGLALINALSSPLPTSSEGASVTQKIEG